jgi:hypothetical protein
MSDPIDFAVDRLIALADELVSLVSRHPSRLDRAAALDTLRMLTGELRDDEVRAAKRLTTWAEVGRAFGITQQAAQKRWG